jgi:protein FRA10AC1
VSAYDRHKQYINDYVLWYGDGSRYIGARQGVQRNDFDVLEEEHRFVWDEDEQRSEMTDEQRFAFKYYKKMFKEFAVADLSKYMTGQVALRWRVEQEVFEGKGQFSCAELSCSARTGLVGWEVPFSYLERGTKKATLVKIRLCASCGKKLNFRKAAMQLYSVGSDADFGMGDDEPASMGRKGTEKKYSELDQAKARRKQSKRQKKKEKESVREREREKEKVKATTKFDEPGQLHTTKIVEGGAKEKEESTCAPAGGGAQPDRPGSGPNEVAGPDLPNAYFYYDSVGQP